MKKTFLVVGLFVQLYMFAEDPNSIKLKTELATGPSIYMENSQDFWQIRGPGFGYPGDQSLKFYFKSGLLPESGYNPYPGTEIFSLSPYLINFNADAVFSNKVTFWDNTLFKNINIRKGYIYFNANTSGKDRLSIWYDINNKHGYIDYKDNLHFRADSAVISSLILQGDGNVAIGYNTITNETGSAKYQTEGHKLAIKGNTLIKGTGNFNTQPDSAVLYLGDNNNYIKSAFGKGVSIGTHAAGDALTIETGTGSVGIGTGTSFNSSGWDKVLEVKGNRYTRILASTDAIGINTSIISHRGGGGWAGTGNGGGYIGTESNHDLYFIAGCKTKMTLKLDGSFGIGTASPISQFQINEGVDKISLGSCYSKETNYGGGYIGFNAARKNGVWTCNTDYANNGGAVIYTAVNGDIYFSTLATTGGKVNTYTDKDVKDNVDFIIRNNGIVQAKEIQVRLDGWPDYVFSKDYKLKSLAEIESFVNENNHLPDVPSSVDVEENGIGLGEMNKILLKKVEELTIYIIEQEKKIDKMQSQINSLIE